MKVSGNLVVGAVLTGLMVAMALVSLVWTPYPPTRINIVRRLAPPSWSNWLGTDPFGRDGPDLLRLRLRVDAQPARRRGQQDLERVHTSDVGCHPDDRDHAATEPLRPPIRRVVC